MARLCALAVVVLSSQTGLANAPDGSGTPDVDVPLAEAPVAKGGAITPPEDAALLDDPATSAKLLPGEKLSPDLRTPKELEGIQLVDRVGDIIPSDIHLTDQDGKSVTTADYLDGRKPLLIVLAYYECPMLCSLVLNGLVDGMKGVEQTPGEDYRVLVVSFDPRDNIDAAAKKRINYLSAFGRNMGERGFDFTVGSEAEVRRLADAVGFTYRWDAEAEQFAHAAGVFIASPEGKLTRTLPGIAFPSTILSPALEDAKNGVTLHTALGQMLLFCFQYDAGRNSYVLAGTRIMKAGGVVTVIAVGAFLLYLFRRDRARADVASTPTKPGNAC